MAYTLRQVFEDLFHPTGRGALSDWIGRTFFRISRRWPKYMPTAGPLAIVSVILAWVFCMTLGFALIYWGSFPGGFRRGSGAPAPAENHFWSMMGFSLGSLTSLSLGDLTPRPLWVRLLAEFEALVGFALLSASVSWMVLLYPALGRMRALARRASALARAEKRTGVEVVSDDAASLLGELALDLIRTRVDLVYFPVIYYFRAEHDNASLPHAIPYLVRFVNQASDPAKPGPVRLAAATLREGLDDVAEVLARRFLHMEGEDADAVFKAYTTQHSAR